MITLWSSSDINGGVEKDWLNECIIYVEHQRDPIPSHVKTTVREYEDAYKGVLDYKPVYNHYVPYGRISKALIKLMENHTRKNIIDSLRLLIEPFGTGTPYFTKQEVLDNTSYIEPTEIEPGDSKFAFHSWVNQIYQNICDWPRNLFLGPSIGDRQGKRIDLPVHHKKQLSNRLWSATDIFRGKMTIDLDDSYTHGSNLNKRQMDPEYDEKDLKFFESIEKKIKTETEANINEVKEDDESYDEYYSEPEDKNRNVPYYKIAEKARLAARSSKNQQEGKNT